MDNKNFIFNVYNDSLRKFTRLKISIYNSKRLMSRFILSVLFFCALIFSLDSSRIAYSADNEPAASFLGFQDEVAVLQERVRTASPGIVSIIVYDNTGEQIGNGSGFFIDREGRIITNAGIFKDAYSAEVKSNTHAYDKIKILATDELNDLAMIQVSAINETPLELSFDYRLIPDEKVLMVGKSESFKDTVAEGIVTSMSDKGETPARIEIKKTIPITYFPDNKDGPVLNSEGTVIGIQSVISEHSIFGRDAIQLDDKKVNAVSIKSIYSLLSGQNVVELHQAGSTEVFAVLKKHLVTAFIVLYGIGFPKLVGGLLGIVVLISLMQWLYIRIRNKFRRGA